MIIGTPPYPTAPGFTIGTSLFALIEGKLVTIGSIISYVKIGQNIGPFDLWHKGHVVKFPALVKTEVNPKEL